MERETTALPAHDAYADLGFRAFMKPFRSRAWLRVFRAVFLQMTGELPDDRLQLFLAQRHFTQNVRSQSGREGSEIFFSR